MTSRLLVFAPLRIEAAALRRQPEWTVLRSGMGPARARIAAARGLAVESRAVAVVGLCAGVSPELRAGDVVCATEVRREGVAPVPVPGSAVLAAALHRRGLRVHAGPIISVERITGPEERSALRADGVLAVDMESAWLAEAADGRPFAILRVVVDTADRRLVDLHTLAAGVRALRTLRRASGALAEWGAAADPRKVLQVARRDDARAYLLDDEGGVDVEVEERTTTTESVQFRLPREVRPA